MSVSFVCTVCQKPYTGSSERYVCPHCGASIETVLDLSSGCPAVAEAITNGSARAEGIWGYRACFPGFSGVEPVSMGEGNTPLMRGPALEADYGIGELLIKNETANPTSTYKDRFASLAVSLFRAEHASAVALGSAGNAGSSVAAYAAKAGIPCYVILPEGGVFARAQQAMSYGARFIRAKGEVNDCIDLIERGVSRYHWKNGCTTMLHNPLASEAYKSIVYELFEQMGETAPDVVICPIGGGILISKVYRAYRELQTLGLTGHMPRLVGVQAAGCQPVVWAMEHGERTTPVWAEPHTIAGSINDPVTFEGVTALHVIRASGGAAVAVTDDEILAAMRLLASREAVVAEPASAATLAAAKKLRRSGWIGAKERVVCVITGSGLRDLPLFAAGAPEGPVVHPDRIDELDQAVKRLSC